VEVARHGDGGKGSGFICGKIYGGEKVGGC
jgi:hypothetical protein